MSLWRCVVAFMLLGAATSACGSEAEEVEPVTLEWDLSLLPRVEEVTSWVPDNPFVDSLVIENVGKVSFTINDQTFEAKGDINDVTITTAEYWIEIVQVDYVPMTVEQAAVTLRELDLPVPDYVIAGWVHTAEGATGQDTPKFPDIQLDQTDFPDVAIGVSTRYSFNDDRPVIVSAVFVWSETLWRIFSSRSTD